jgi:predicted porin
MNKKLIALAVAAGVAAPMSAQAAPTLYGQLQAEIASEGVDVTGGPTTADGRIIQGGGGRFQEDVGIDDNKRGRLGVKGSEDLGGGLKAIYKFEWQVDTANGNPNDGARNSFVGLKGGFGQVELGRIKSAYKYYGGVKYDPFVTTELEARRYGGMTTGAFGHNSFLNSTLGYQGKFGLVAFRVTYNLDEQDGTNGDLTAGIKVGSKTWEVGAAIAHDENDATAADDAYDALKVFGKMKFGMVTIRGQVETTEDEADTREGQIVFLGADFKVGKGVISAQASTNTVELAGSPDQEGDYLAIGYTHKFTKKARIFAGYGEMTADNMNNVANANNGRDALTVGMRIDF